MWRGSSKLHSASVDGDRSHTMMQLTSRRKSTLLILIFRGLNILKPSNITSLSYKLQLLIIINLDPSDSESSLSHSSSWSANYRDKTERTSGRNERRREISHTKKNFYSTFHFLPHLDHIHPEVYFVLISNIIPYRLTQHSREQLSEYTQNVPLSIFFLILLCVERVKWKSFSYVRNGI